MTPDSPIVDLARKTAKSIVDHGSIPMATLKESIKLHDKVDELLAKEIVFPEPVPFPEIPEVDLSPISEKLDELMVETKKKDLLEYDLQIDEKTRKKLKGDKGDRGFPGLDGYTPIKGKDYFDGEQGKPGKDGSPDTAEQVRDKLEELKEDERLDISAVRGVDKKIEKIAKKIAKEEVKKIEPSTVTVMGSGGSGTLILTSPDGTRWQLGITNAGEITATSL